jgi:hypothetical protein
LQDLLEDLIIVEEEVEELHLEDLEQLKLGDQDQQIVFQDHQ